MRIGLQAAFPKTLFPTTTPRTSLVTFLMRPVSLIVFPPNNTMTELLKQTLLKEEDDSRFIVSAMIPAVVKNLADNELTPDQVRSGVFQGVYTANRKLGLPRSTAIHFAEEFLDPVLSCGREKRELDPSYAPVGC